MNRSSRGFGLTGVAVAVAAMILMAVFSTSARSEARAVQQTETNAVTVVSSEQ
ncbi:hypothetical protein QTP81_06255 [Alteromonas sp. ASW11-36]|uniref:Uncharacterized protein n=1 Tax=Alteromonas arenosi TaxID=3055817 RepID=A0ABT7SXB4_9ALTE|nr:hypothetical protein [Alteromonas sp. ASW11-36]MDM7860192.1 hypothetical protein [Alteromonas sp. ASW11-36]